MSERFWMSTYGVVKMFGLFGVIGVDIWLGMMEIWIDRNSEICVSGDSKLYGGVY